MDCNSYILTNKNPTPDRFFLLKKHEFSMFVLRNVGFGINQKFMAVFY